MRGNKATFHLNGVMWTVKLASSAVIKKHGGGRQDLLGYCMRDKALIYIDKDLHKDQRRDVFLHELTHAFLGLYPDENKFDEELICNLVASGFNQLYISEELTQILESL